METSGDVTAFSIILNCVPEIKLQREVVNLTDKNKVNATIDALQHYFSSGIAFKLL